MSVSKCWSKNPGHFVHILSHTACSMTSSKITCTFHMLSLEYLAALPKWLQVTKSFFVCNIGSSLNFSSHKVSDNLVVTELGFFLLVITVMGPSGNALIIFHASKRESPCMAVVCTCSSSSPGWTGLLCSNAVPGERKCSSFNSLCGGDFKVSFTY